MDHDRFEVLTSILIAVVTICGALTAWRAGVAAIQTGDADFDGISAAIRSQEARIVNSVQAYEHLRAYTDYFRSTELRNSLEDDGSLQARREQSELSGIALGLQKSFFPSRYLDEEGNFNIERELDELWAESRSQNDLIPDPHFERADTYRDKGSLLIGSLIVFSFSFLFLTIGQAIRNRLRYFFALLGSAALLGGICSVLVFEFAL